MGDAVVVIGEDDGGEVGPLPGTIQSTTDLESFCDDVAGQRWDVSPNGEWRSPRALILGEPLPEQSYKAIGALVERFPELFVAAGDGADPSLAWLQHMPALRGLHLGWLDVSSLERLEYVPGLRALELRGSYRSAPSLKALRHVPLLEELELSDQGTDFEAIADLARLRALRLYRMPVRALEPLAQLHDLELLKVSFGRVRDFSPLAGLSRLRGIDLWQIRGLTSEHLRPFGELEALEALNLGAMRTITDLEPLLGRPARSFKYLSMEGLTGFTDFRGLARLPVLEEVALWAGLNERSDFTELLHAPRLDALVVERKFDPAQAEALWAGFRGRHLAVNGRVRTAAPGLRVGWRSGSATVLHASTRRRQWVGDHGRND